MQSPGTWKEQDSAIKFTRGIPAKPHYTGYMCKDKHDDDFKEFQ